MERRVAADRSVSHTLISAVAEVEGCCPTDLPPLYDTLDADALDALFSGGTSCSPQCEGNLTFEYSDSSVTIWSDRSVLSQSPRSMTTHAKRGAITRNKSGDERT